MFLQVLWLSDVCTGNGKQLLMGNWWNYQATTTLRVQMAKSG